MSSSPTFKEYIQAIMHVRPGFFLAYLAAISIVVGRGAWANLNDLSLITAVGLFTPWFGAWVVALCSAMVLSIHTDDIENKARQLSARRIRAAYGELH